LEDYKLPYCHSGPSDCSDLLSAVQTLRPTALIGCDQQGDPPPFAFDQHVVGTMADNTRHPLIFPLTCSPPECSPQDAYTWSGGRAIVATCGQVNGSTGGFNDEQQPSQITSTYIFPGVGKCNLSEISTWQYQIIRP
jgi:malate dehydrogenase (oxaloacetate-decarboxylating)(NADP+)